MAEKPASQADIIDSILSEKYVVEVNGRPLTLTVPTAAAALQLRKFHAALVGDGETGETKADLAEVGLTLAGAAVRACLADLDEESAVRLVLVSGGEFGGVARRALQLCGLGVVLQQALAEGQADRPT